MKRLWLIALGYALAIAGGFAAVALNEMRIAKDAAEASGGMVAFGDMVLFLLATGFLALVPSWFLLKLLLEKAPRPILAALLLVAVAGPPSWLAVAWLADGPRPRALANGAAQLLGPLIAFGAMPRIVLGPVLLAVEAAAFVLVSARKARALLAAAMLLDLVPLGLFAAHMAAGARH